MMAFARNIAYDMDNVLCHQTTRYKYDGFLYSNLPGYELVRHMVLRPIVKIEDAFVVITSRPKSMREITHRWFKFHGYGGRLIVCPDKFLSNPLDVAKFKLTALQDLGITTYVEDNELIRQYLIENGIIVKYFDKGTHPLVGQTCKTTDTRW